MYKLSSDDTIAVIGLGYVGLPLAVEFARQTPTVGFDINDARICELKAGVDRTQEVSAEELAGASRLSYTSSPEDLASCKVFIVTVPTPINRHKQPDLTPLIRPANPSGKLCEPGVS